MYLEPKAKTKIEAFYVKYLNTIIYIYIYVGTGYEHSFY